MKRSFASSITAILLCVVLITTGCSTAWVAQAEQIVAALVPAVSNIIILIGAFNGKGISAEDLAAVKVVADQANADLKLIESLIKQYDSADPATKASILDKINVAIQDAQSNLSGVLTAVHIKDPALQAKIQAVVGIVLAEVQSLAVIIPLVKSGNLTAAKSVKAPLSAKQFKAAFNRAVDQVGPGFRIK